MTVETLQVLVGKTHTDENFKDTLLTDPLAVLSEFDLTDRETKLVLVAAKYALLLADNPLVGFARVLANSEIVNREASFPLSPLE